MLGNFACFLSSVDFFHNYLFGKFIRISLVSNSLDLDHVQGFGPELA